MDIAIMQRGRAILALTVLVLASSCYQEEEMFLQDDLHGMKKMTVEASWDDGPETRTVRQSDGRIFWSPGDKINLFYGSSPGSEFTATITEPSATAPFEGYLLAATGASEQGVATQTFWGVYPYDAANTCDGTGVYLTVKGTQVSSPGSFGNGMNPAVANSPGLSLSFKNVGSWFVFSVLSSGVTSVTFSGNNGEDIAGKVHVTLDSSGKPVSEVVEGEGLKSITVTPENGNEFIPNTDYYITLLPQTLSQGYTFTMYTGDGKVAIRKTESSKTFVLSQHSTGRKIDKDLPWQTLYVDMGDGVMWATMNVGASSPQDFGDYFAWGETTTKDNYSWSTYSYGTESNLTKYNSADGLTRLQPGDDAATVNWGGDWRTPTEEEWAWLTNDNNCTWTKSYNPYGYTVTSRINGNSIFLPLAGYYWEQPNSNYTGYYWSSDLSSTYLYEARMRMFDSGSTNSMTDSNRSVGRSVRPVRGMSAASREYVELGPGIKWATMNIGANSREEKGNYFAWGETVPKSSYSWSNYAFGSETALTKYVSDSDYGTPDGYQTLLPGDDAATVAWGGDWRTPTQQEWAWLMDNCSIYWTSIDGVDGVWVQSRVTGYTNKGIFLPFTGFYYNSSLQSVLQADYWSSSLLPSNPSQAYRFNAWYADGEPGEEGYTFKGTINLGRQFGHTVRAVYMPRVNVTGLALDMSSLSLEKGSTANLTPVFTPSDVTESGVLWTSSNVGVAKVNGTGMVTAVGVGTATITATSVDGGFTSSCTITVTMSYVDMGEGYLWAKTNLGANSPEEYGDYFAWGEIAPKTNYSQAGYTVSAYNSTDGKTILDPADDAVTQSSDWGADWHIPTIEEWEWLTANCTWEWTTQNGVNGGKFTSNITGNSIFLPATGFKSGTSSAFVGERAQYWSSSLYDDTENARTFSFYSGHSPYTNRDVRYNGRAVRPVRRAYVVMGEDENGVLQKWATKNVGADSPEDYGDSFAWGETAPKDEYSWNTYAHGTSSSSLTKYVVDETYGIVDNKTVLEVVDDAATANWGGTWRMPTYSEWLWLKTNCTWTWTDDYRGTGVAGEIVTATNDNSIFLPAAGYWDRITHINAGSKGYYWSSSLFNSESYRAWFVWFSSSNVGRDYFFRSYGRSVRPVSD